MRLLVRALLYAPVHPCVNDQPNKYIFRAREVIDIYIKHMKSSGAFIIRQEGTSYMNKCSFHILQCLYLVLQL
jgi:hypothetical protein